MYLGHGLARCRYRRENKTNLENNFFVFIVKNVNIQQWHIGQNSYCNS